MYYRSAPVCNAGIDQTRGWFYTLMVLSTALFEKPAFKSLVCNGLILAEDGKKMSKRLRNYPVSRLCMLLRSKSFTHKSLQLCQACRATAPIGKVSGCLTHSSRGDGASSAGWSL